METIELKDFLDFKFLSNVEVNCEDTLIFVEHLCDEENNTYKHRLMMQKDNQTIALTNGDKESNYCVLQNGDVVFSAIRDTQDKKKVEAQEEFTSFYRISTHGGEAYKYFEVPYQVAQLIQLDEDHFAMLVDYDTRYSYANESDEKQTAIDRKKENADYEEFTQIPFYLNGGGYTSGLVTRLYIYEVSTNTMKAISDTTCMIEQMKWDRDAKKIYCVTSVCAQKQPLKNGVSVYDLESATFSEVIPQNEYSIYTVESFNSGLIMIANKEVVYGNNDNPKFFFVDVHTKEVTLLYDNDNAIYNSVGSDCRYGGGKGLQVVDDVCYYLTTIKDKCEVHSVDKDGNSRCYLRVDGSVDCFTINKDAMYFVAMINNKLQEVYSYKDGKVTQLTNENTKLDNKYVANYKEIVYENDGVQLTGWVLLPKNYDSSKQYPAILDIHGGPKTVYGKVYYHEMQVWANMGYIVFFTNPRGSDGFGSAFANIYGAYGTIDYNDLMKFTDVVLEEYAIDKTRVGVTGGSYGGFMSNWIVSHTDRFACCATQRSISNWVSFYGTSDIGYHFAQDQIRGNIFNNVEKLWNHSPLKYVSNVKTPTLIIHSDEDYRCPLEQGLQWYTALCDLNVETKLVMFRKENHELSRSGLPKHRVKRLEEITNWMEKYLK